MMGTNSPEDADNSLGVAVLGHTFSRTLHYQEELGIMTGSGPPFQNGCLWIFRR
jgi:hypothetical protein